MSQQMPATAIAETIGRDRGLTVLKHRIRDLRPAYRPVDPASRTVYEPGENRSSAAEYARHESAPAFLTVQPGQA
ncbi:hypothetical protein ACFVY1_41530 [Streptomyces sp. NPDC058293]|uniref:hypothetical protein n=1 Tax=Streptomyces sp. NPDC058293 TaxID=3346429 RepID=UPI0036E0D922